MRPFRKKDVIKFYTSIKNIPIFNFFETYENQDIRYILKLDSYDELPSISDKLSSQLTGIFEDISNDYSELLNIRADKFVENNQKIMRLSLKKNRINYIVSILRYKYFPDIKVDHGYLENELKNYGYQLNYSNELEFYEELNKIGGKTKGIDFNIKSIEQELENIKDQKYNYLDSIVIIEETLGIRFNIYKDSMSYFISCKNRFNQKIKPKVA